MNSDNEGYSITNVRESFSIQISDVKLSQYIDQYINDTILS